MKQLTRRRFVQLAGASLAAGILNSNRALPASLQVPGERPVRDSAIRVLNPRNRVPVSLIIDDSTCLVNLAHFAMPQFAEVWPGRAEYQKPWKEFPREIPDSFVRRFMDWCEEHGVKGKYSVVPYPACVGWLDRDLPGWSHQELVESLRLVRERIMPRWDIHPEMVTHTWVINTKTGRPYEERSARFMENWGWSEGRSVDELTDYLAYALRILKNVDLHCEGITTPGGFGSRARPQLAQATLEACRDVFRTEIPHYFRDLFTDERSVAPRVEYASGLDGDDPKCVVSIIGCTGDWFGGWDGTTEGSADLFITPDLAKGRMVDVIGREEPAIMVCHWPGIYFNGEERGFEILKTVVQRLHARYENLIWMNLAEIARYWAARELTRIEKNDTKVVFSAPFSAPLFTIQLTPLAEGVPAVGRAGEEQQRLRRVGRLLDLTSGTYCEGSGTNGTERLMTLCFDLPKGTSELVWLG
ncbi:MAG: hypothetical protein WBH86_08235 [Thermogutta sp.]|nr:hypothetical protein [Thermogutta sp.]HPU05103.1 hypothetical protein [Thermogutta sp.]HQF14736.1 hypothetical protein [Thermogutta sp.]